MKPFERHDLVPAIEVALARFEPAPARRAGRQRRGAPRGAQARRPGQGHLMDAHGMSEKDAFGFIQRTAMACAARCARCAEDILSGELTPEAATKS
ncbi:MAG: hypothetical protein R2716_12285 [Microthrixaceae bacterium]